MKSGAVTAGKGRSLAFGGMRKLCKGLYCRAAPGAGAPGAHPPPRRALCSYALATATRLPCAPPSPVPLPWSSSSCRPCPSHTQARQWRHLVGFLAVVEHRYGLDRAGRLRAGWQRHRRPGPRLPLHPLHEHPRVSSHGHRHHPRHGLVRAVPLCGPHPSYLPLQRLRPGLVRAAGERWRERMWAQRVSGWWGWGGARGWESVGGGVWAGETVHEGG